MQYVGAIDQSTTSTRFIIFDRGGATIASAQREHRQIFPQPGWVEHDLAEIWTNAQEVTAQTLAKAGLTTRDLAAAGITNARRRRSGAVVPGIWARLPPAKLS